MTKKRIQIRNVQNVAASKTALINLPVGDRYHYVVLQHGYSAGTNTIAAACSNITEIRVKVNGRVQRVISGTQLRDMNLLNGTQYDCTGLPNTAPGVSFPIFFREQWRESP
ncbi:MAG TPA: major capsid protein P2, partial [Verrucomicrobiae bacterium]|nr:major capsid protein P2 [Verrucomicrobiae bacterium]